MTVIVTSVGVGEIPDDDEYDDPLPVVQQSINEVKWEEEKEDCEHKKHSHAPITDEHPSGDTEHTTDHDGDDDGDHHKADHATDDDGATPLYTFPRQRQRWGDKQVVPHKNWGDIFF